MASLVGSDGIIQIAGETVAELRSYSIEVTADTIETSTMGTNSRTFTNGLSQFSGTCDVYWDPNHFADEASGSGGPDLLDKLQAEVGSVTTGGAGDVSLTIYSDTASGDSWTGDIVITGYSINASFDGLIEASVSFQGTGALTYTA